MAIKLVRLLIVVLVLAAARSQVRAQPEERNAVGQERTADVSGSDEAEEAKTPRPQNPQQDGVGVELMLADGSLKVMKVLRDSLADKAGLRVGDRITAVDGRPIGEMAVEDVAGVLRGIGGSTVTLTVTSDGAQPWQLKIRRELFAVRRFRDAAASNAAVEAAAQAHRRELEQRRAAQHEQRLEALRFLQNQQRDIEDALKANFDRLRDPFASEVQFMTKVGELSAEQIAALKRNGEQALERRSVQFHSGAARRRVRQVVVMVNGKPAVRDEWSEPPQVIVRRELTGVLKALSHDAWEKFDAQRERLDERRKRAEVLVQVAAFDEALLLTHDEREEFSNLLAQRWNDVWRGHLDQNAAANPAQLCLTAIGAMDLFSIPRVELESVLRPRQLAAFDLVQLPTRLEAVFVEQLPPQDQVAPIQGAGNNAAAGPERLRFGAGKIVRHGVPLSEERQRLESLLQRLIEDAQIHAALDDEQRQKLLLAGKLDLGRYFDEQTALYEKPPGGRAFVVPQEQIAGAKVRLPPVLSGPDSVFQKTLRRRLSPQQAAKLADAQGERDRFHRQAVLHALTVGLSQSASLTDEQAERVQLVLTERLNNAEETGDVVERRHRTLRQLAELRPDEIKPLVDDWQWTAAREYLIELAATARGLDAQQGLPREPEEELLAIPPVP